MKKRQFTVYGRVQGVGFRFHTAKQARKIGILGSVRNLMDNSVLVIAIGYDEQLDSFREWLKIGSPAARVDHIVEQDYLCEHKFSDFNITY